MAISVKTDVFIIATTFLLPPNPYFDLGEGRDGGPYNSQLFSKSRSASNSSLDNVTPLPI